MKILSHLSLSIILTSLLSSAQAATITGVGIHDVTDHWGSRTADKVINGSGFNATTRTHDTNPDNMWLSSGSFAPTPSTPLQITFDLGSNYSVSAIDVWNYNEGPLAIYAGRGAKDVDILVADSITGSFALVDSFVFNAAPLSGSVDFSQNIDLASYGLTGDVRLIRFLINSNHGSEPYTGLSEVRFIEGDVASVPAPLTLALFSLGLVAMTSRHKRPLNHKL